MTSASMPAAQSLLTLWFTISRRCATKTTAPCYFASRDNGWIRSRIVFGGLGEDAPQGGFSPAGLIARGISAEESKDRPTD
jgi:hypothetical protein